MQFNKIKVSIDEEICKNIKENNQAGIKTLLNTIKKESILAEQWKVYNEIENFINSNDIIISKFIEESISRIESLGEENISKSNNVFEKITVDKGNTTLELFESLLFTEKNKDYYSNYTKLIECVKNSLASKISNDYCLEYSTLSEDVKNVFKTTLELKEVFPSVKNICLEFINSEIKESTDIDVKGKLVDVKSKVLDLSESKENLNLLINLLS